MADTVERPILLGIGGDSGSGKTTIARGLYRLFGAGNILSICLDDYHSLDRRARQQAGVTALNPVANRIDLMEEQLWALKDGRSVLKPVYDHATGTFGPPEQIHPKPWIVVRGLFPFFTERLREAFDVRVWLDPDEELKYHWKVQRDVAQRGYSVAQVIRQVVERQDDLRRYILPQARYADMVVRFYPPPGYFGKAGAGGSAGNGHGAETPPDLHVRLTLRRSAPAPGVAEAIARAAALDQEHHGTRRGAGGVRIQRGAEGGETMVEVDAGLDGHVAAPLVRDLASMLPIDPRATEEMGVFLAGGRDPKHSHSLLITQLAIAWQMVAAHESTRSLVTERASPA
ncbi:MAG: phosphoribulokinase [Limnochordaceae bacterium]|nr:phosphoribulokinase [Limnochordaceae bacterium]